MGKTLHDGHHPVMLVRGGDSTLCPFTAKDGKERTDYFFLRPRRTGNNGLVTK